MTPPAGVVPPLPPVPPSPASPDGWFGFSIRCSECGWERIGTEPTPRWESSVAPEIGIVAPGSPADRAGFKTGDRITHINGVSILAPEGARRFGAVAPGQRIRLTVTRNGTPITRELTLEERPRASYDRRSLRYTGRLSGVAVEVWSAAGATVQREGDTMVINVGGSTVRLKATTPAPSR
jgi:membrane-associated protease RseP (regulator of RpoE activity)